LKLTKALRLRRELSGVVIGSIRSLKEKTIALRAAFDDNFIVSYNKTRLLWRPSGLIYCRIQQ